MEDESVEQGDDTVPVIRRKVLVVVWLCLVAALGLAPVAVRALALITHR